MKQEIAAVPASRFGLHLSDEAHPAARGYVRDDLTREGALRVPELPRGWHFAPEAYDGIVGWWNWGGAEPLLITGPAGSGKTASVLAFCAVMQMPAVVFTARPRMDRRELIGRWVLGPSGMTWVDGPAALAWRNGWVLLINEFSAAPPEVWVSANDLLEGLPLEIDQTGEVIDRHPLARIVFTDNTRGHSTELAAGYFGRQIQDRSVIDRMWHLRCEGLHEADEARVLLASLEADLVVRAGEAAAEEICALAARAAAGSRCKAAQSPLGFENRSFALSIRAARRFAKLTLRYAAGDLPVSADPIAAAADTAVGNALDRPVRDALVTYLKTIFGERITELRQMRAESSAPVRRNPRSSRPKACTETPALS